MRVRILLYSVVLILMAALHSLGGTPEERIYEAIQTFFETAYEDENAMLDLNVNRVPEAFLTETINREIRVSTQRNVPRLGRQTVWLEAWDGPVMADKTPVSIDIALVMPVCVSLEKIDRHGTLSSKNVGLERKRIDRDPDTIYKTTDAILNMQSTRVIRKGNIIQSRFVRIPPEISVGDQVRLKIRTSRLVITTTGIAKQEGAKGETISVLCESTGKRIEGVVASPSLVIVDQEI